MASCVLLPQPSTPSRVMNDPRIEVKTLRLPELPDWGSLSRRPGGCAISKACLPGRVDRRSELLSERALFGLYFTASIFSGCQLLNGSPDVRMFSSKQKRGFYGFLIRHLPGVYLSGPVGGPGCGPGPGSA